jgi:hypothetical protein
MTNRHERFRSLLPAYLNDLLPAGDAAWLDAHAAECESCRALLERVRARLPELGADAGHAPARALEVWVYAADSFTPLERELVGRHLAGCSACRGDAEAIARGAGLAFVLPAAEPPRVHGWRAWGAAGLIAAAGLVAMLATHALDPSQAIRTAPAPADETPGAATAPPSAGPAATAVPQIDPLLSFADRERGSQPNPTLVDTLRGDTRSLRVRLPLLTLPSDARVAVSVLRADGAVMTRQLLEPARLKHELRLRARTGIWEPGDYRLLVIPDAGLDTVATREYAFRLVPGLRGLR